MISPKLEFRRVVFSYGGAFTIGPIEHSFASGKITVLLGKSGSGKSTILRLAAKLLSPAEGEVYLEPPLGNQGPTLYSMVFQDYVLYPHLTVRENAALQFQVPKAEHSRRVNRFQSLAPILGIDHLADRKATELSGGERQRVAILKVLISGAPIWLMDEPLSNLDERNRLDIRRAIFECQHESGSTLIYVTHDLPDALAIADELVLLSRGQTLQSGSVLELLDNPQHLDVGRFLASPPANELSGQLKVTSSGTAEVWLNGVRPTSIPIQLSGDQYVDSNVVALIPPDDVTLTPETSEGCALRIEGMIEIIEYGHTRSLIECKTSVGTIRFYCPRTTVVRPKESLTLNIDGTNLRWFDATTGRRLA